MTTMANNGGNFDTQYSKMSSLLNQKKQEEDMRLKTVIEKLKNKGNKKISFKQLRNVDNERMLQQQIQNLKLNEFRAKNQKLLASDMMTNNGSVTTTSNLGFTVTENQRSLHKIPQKPVKMRNAILGGHDWTV